jgi:hypothetical protein
VCQKGSILYSHKGKTKDGLRIKEPQTSSRMMRFTSKNLPNQQLGESIVGEASRLVEMGSKNRKSEKTKDREFAYIKQRFSLTFSDPPG